MRKIVFIEPKPAGEHIFTQFALPRIGIFILATMMKNRGWDARIMVEDITAIDYSELSDADIIGISTITPTAINSYVVANTARRMGITVIMGGPHVTFLPEEALEYADFVIRGEGEVPLMRFIDAWETDRDYSRVPNLSFRNDDGYTHNPMLPFEDDLDRLPVSDFSLMNDQARLKVIPVQTSRGCPYDCSFCSVTGMFGKKYRFRSTDHILDELRSYRNAGKMIFFYDDHFAANRKRAKELLRAMIDEGLTFKWSTQVRADIVNDPELLDLMKRSGCHTLFIGFESFNPESLKEMKKKQTVEDIIRAVRIIHEHKIHIHGMFVHGFDSDTWDSVKLTVNLAKKMKLTSAQFLMLTPFPGSEFYNHVSKRIVYDDWSMYDAHHVVYRPRHFSLQSLQRAQTYSHEKFYSAVEIIKKMARKNWIAAGIAVYARIINRRWKKNNKEYLRELSRMKRHSGKPGSKTFAVEKA